LAEIQTLIPAVQIKQLLLSTITVR